VFTICSEELAKIALSSRYDNIEGIKKAPCVSLREYRRIKDEVAELEKFLLQKRKQRLGFK